MHAREIAKTLFSRKFHYKDEKELQHGIGLVLTELGVDWKAEVVLTPKDRIDFMVGEIGIEVKVDFPEAAVTRQLWRYAQHDKIKALILVTTRSKHRDLPAEINGKPLFVVWLLNSFL